jgi:hypothetical protein
VTTELLSAQSMQNRYFSGYRISKKVILLKIIPTKRSENSISILDAEGNDDLESIV